MNNPARSDFWTEDGISIRLNPRVDLNTTGLAGFIRHEIGIESAIVLSTSGTTGDGPKYVVLKKAAMLASAQAVNEQLDITKSDRWLAALTLFHVGGLGIFARAAVSGCGVVSVDDPLMWDRTGTEFVKAVAENEVTLSALTPVHLSDLVKNNHAAPSSLRGVLIGGGAMSETLAESAIELGWPIWPTYGMTETCSQIATSIDSQAAITSWLPLLSGWEVRAENEICEVRGDALFSGYVTKKSTSSGDEWQFDAPFDEEGWYETGDRFELRKDDTELRFLGRRDDLVKSLGELVSIKKLESVLAEAGITGVVFPIPDERRGHRFIAVVEGDCGSKMEAVNEQLPPFERLDEIISLEELPRTVVGKIAKGELQKLVQS